MKKTLRFTFKNIRRMPYQSLAAITVLTVTFFISQAFTLLTLGSQQVLVFFESRPQISAYFTNQALEEDILDYKQQLESKPYVKKVAYISKEEAFQIYRLHNQDDPLLLEMVTANTLPASLEVSPVSIDDLDQIQADLDSLPTIEDVFYQEDVVDALARWTKTVRQVGLLLISFLTVTSILIIVIIIGMKVAARRHEIKIMRLLGANNWFITGPFILEGALYGAIGAIIAWVINYTIILYSTPFLIDFLGEIPLIPVNPLAMLVILASGIAFGTTIGILGSAIAVRRYFK